MNALLLQISKCVKQIGLRQGVYIWKVCDVHYPGRGVGGGAFQVLVRVIYIRKQQCAILTSWSWWSLCSHLDFPLPIMQYPLAILLVKLHLPSFCLKLNLAPTPFISLVLAQCLIIMELHVVEWVLLAKGDEGSTQQTVHQDAPDTLPAICSCHFLEWSWD